MKRPASEYTLRRHGAGLRGPLVQELKALRNAAGTTSRRCATEEQREACKAVYFTLLALEEIFDHWFDERGPVAARRAQGYEDQWRRDSWRTNDQHALAFMRERFATSPVVTIEQVRAIDELRRKVASAPRVPTRIVPRTRVAEDRELEG